MFWSKNKKNRYTPAYPSFKKWGIRGYTLHGHVFSRYSGPTDIASFAVSVDIDKVWVSAEVFAYRSVISKIVKKHFKLNNIL